MRRHAKATLLSALLCSFFALSVTPALAGYVTTGTFGEAGAGDGQLNNPRRVAIERSTGNLFIVDRENDRIQVFAPQGNSMAYLTQFGATTLDAPYGIAVSEQAGQTTVYVTSNTNGGEIVKFDSDEQPTPGFTVDGTFTSPAQGTSADRIQSFDSPLALAPNGDLWVADRGASVVKRFDPTGAHVGGSNFDGSNGSTAFTGLLDLATDTTGDLILVESSDNVVGDASGTSSKVLRFSSAGAFEGEIGPTNGAGSVATDPDDDSVLVGGKFHSYNSNELPHLYLFAADGTPIVDFDLEETVRWSIAAGLAADQGTGRVYALMSEAGEFGFACCGAEKGLVLEDLLPPKVSIDTVDTDSITGTQATFTGLVDPNGIPTEWHFEFRIVGGVHWRTSPSEDAGSGQGPVAVNFTAAGLHPNEEYELRLLAQNVAGGAESAQPNPTFATDEIPPTVRTVEASFPSPTEARLKGQVNPNNSQTNYWFEWGTSDCSINPCQSIPVSRDADAGSGIVKSFVSTQISGLTPGATYYFRIAAANGVDGPASGESLTFTTPIAQGCANADGLGANVLPDCRAWEMVSPSEKNGGDLLIDTTHFRVSDDGTAASFSSLVGFGDSIGSGVITDYAAVRSAKSSPSENAWATHAITPPQPPVGVLEAATGQLPSYHGDFSPDLSKGVFYAWKPIPASAEAGHVATLYLRENLRSPGAGNYTLITDCPLCKEPGGQLLPTSIFVKPTFVDTSADFSRILFNYTGPNLTDEAPAQGGLCDLIGFKCKTRLYEFENGIVRLAGILPDSACAAPPCPADESVAGYGLGGDQTYVHQTMSDDGLRIFFTDRENAAGNIYMRTDATSTVHLNASERSIPDAPEGARYWDAAADGSRIFFTSSEALSDDSPDGGQQQLYMYDAEKPDSAPDNLTPLSPGSEVATVIGASADGQYVYFTSQTQIIDGGPPFKFGQRGIFVWHDGEIAFVAESVVSDDEMLGNTGGPNFGRKKARIAENGALLFPTGAPIGPTGYSHGDPCPTAIACWREFYLYDPDSKELNCVTCNPSGNSATDDAEIMPRASVGAAGATSHLNNALSRDGRYVFFTSAEKLVAGDINGVSDAYRYDNVSDKVALLSSGEDPSPSYFVEASPSGKDAFFLTRERLSGWDVDNAFDLYDARVDGGAPEPPPPPPSCVGDACQPAPRQLNDPTPSSSSFVGGRDSRQSLKRRCARKKQLKKRRGQNRCTGKRGRAIKDDRRATR